MDERRQVDTLETASCAAPFTKRFVARDAQLEFELSARGEFTQFGFVGEVGAVRALYSNLISMRQHERAPEHRAQRRDAGAASDEQEAAFRRRLWEREAAERSFDVDHLADLETERRLGAARAIAGDEQFEAIVLLAVFR